MSIYSKRIEGLTNDETYFVKVFTVNPKGRVNNRVDLPFVSVIPFSSPKEPTGYNLLVSPEPNADDSYNLTV